MTVSMKQIEEMIEDFAPLRFACEWDNSGFAINLGSSVSSVLVCLDVTEEVIEEAAGKTAGSSWPTIRFF